MRRRWLTVLLTALLAGLLTVPAAEAKRGGNGNGHTTYASAAEILRIHNEIAPTVVEYADVTSITATVVNNGPDGYYATSGPGYGKVVYNSYYQQTAEGWARTVSHEIGGHHDAWAEIVAHSGVQKAWTDYYDLDVYAEPWAEARFLAVMGYPRDFTPGLAKEVYLDAVGPALHGYIGVYLRSLGLTTLDQQRAFAVGNEDVMAAALK